MASILLKHIDISNEEDIIFTYEVLKYRFANVDKQQINYKSRKDLPSYEEHITQLKANNYKGLYKIMIESYPLGTIHVNQHDEVGIFFLPSLVKNALKNCKKNNIKVDIDYLSLQSFIQLYKHHPEIERYYCSVNPSNHLSIKALERHGFVLNELIYTMKAKNGKIAQGPWSCE